MPRSATSISKVSLALLALFILPQLTFAADWKALKPQGYVSDFANVIDPESKQSLESYAARVQQATGVQLAFVTLQGLEGEPIEDVTNDIFHSFGVGRKKEDDGAMVLLSVADRKSRLEAGGGLGEIVPDSMAGLLLDDMRPELREAHYGAAMITAAQRLGETIAKAKNVAIPPPAAVHQQHPRSVQDSIPWPLIFFGIFILLMLMRGRGGRGPGIGGGGGGFWTGMLLGQLLNSGNRGWGGRDGGGFGGFDSGGGGGGFGGFGGGDSGGGGASSDW